MSHFKYNLLLQYNQIIHQCFLGNYTLFKFTPVNSTKGNLTALDFTDVWAASWLGTWVVRMGRWSGTPYRDWRCSSSGTMCARTPAFLSSEVDGLVLTVSVCVNQLFHFNLYNNLNYGVIKSGQLEDWLVNFFLLYACNQKNLKGNLWWNSKWFSEHV